MYDEENNHYQDQVIQEEISQDRLPIQPDVQEEKPEQAEAKPEQIVKADSPKKYTEEQQERNFYELRRMHEQNARELELIRRENEQLRQMTLAAQPKKDDLGIAPNAFVERNHVERLIEQRLKEQEERYQKQLATQRQQEAERTLTLQYKDLYEVLSTENLRRLEVEEPEIAASIAANPDTYSAKIAAYKQIKKLGIVEESYNERRVNERLAQNASRPKSPTNLAPRQGSQSLANAASRMSGYEETLTEEMQARYRKEMEDAIARM